MKKTVITLATFSIFLLNSCKKQYYCECTYASISTPDDKVDAVYSDIQGNSIIESKSSSDAQKVCEDWYAGVRRTSPGGVKEYGCNLLNVK